MSEWDERRRIQRELDRVTAEADRYREEYEAQRRRADDLAERLDRTMRGFACVVRMAEGRITIPRRVAMEMRPTAYLIEYEADDGGIVVELRGDDVRWCG